MNEGSLILTSSVVARLSELVGVSASAFPRTRPSYPSRTIHVSHPLHVSRISPSRSNHHSKKGETHLRMPALTTARTTAFIPALSPPDVRTASFIFP